MYMAWVAENKQDETPHHTHDETTEAAAADDRCSRFVESSLETVTKSASVNAVHTYYQGDFVTERMNIVRDSITYVRENWHRYSDQMKLLRSGMEGIEDKVDNKRVLQFLDSLFNVRKNWSSSVIDVMHDTFDVLHLYTSQQGYVNVFSIVNHVFRSDLDADSTELIRNAVFLIELLNIDLFNYCRRYPQCDNFQGLVYRGMNLPPEDFQTFYDLRNQPIDKRYIAVPLSLWSSSNNIKVAKSFIEKDFEKNADSDKMPLIMEIEVVEMKPEYLSYYRSRYPKSIVSTICAVDITYASEYKHEKEVLLRGAFLQVLDVYEGDVIHGRQCLILRMLMLNTNRDHISTMQLGHDSAGTRQLVGLACNVTRCEHAIRYYQDKKLHKDEEEYQKILDDKLAQIEDIMQQHPVE